MDKNFDHQKIDNEHKERLAKCPYCGTIEPSDQSLPFFMYIENKEYDTFYCGCRGWD